MAENIGETMRRIREGGEGAPLSESVTTVLTTLFGVLDLLQDLISIGKDTAAHPSVRSAAEAAEKATGVLQKAVDDLRTAQGN